MLNCYHFYSSDKNTKKKLMNKKYLDVSQYVNGEGLENPTGTGA